MTMIIGHEKIVDYLKRATRKGRLSHAYLFYGPRNVGKGTLAREFAKILQCEKIETSTNIACGRCRSCRAIDKELHPDVVFLRGEEGEIKIAEIRKLRKHLSLGSYQSFYKIAIIEEAEKMNNEAANALLKTLEEPSAKTIIILIASSHKLLIPTLVSRSELVKFSLVPARHMREGFKGGEKKNEENFEILMKMARGRPGLFFRFLTEKTYLDNYSKTLKGLRDLLRGSYFERLKYAEVLTKNSGEIPQILEVWLTWFRDLLLVAEDCGELVVNYKERDILKEDSKRYSPINLKRIIDLMLETKFLITNTNINPRLAFEALVLEIF